MHAGGSFPRPGVPPHELIKPLPPSVGPRNLDVDAQLPHSLPHPATPAWLFIDIRVDKPTAAVDQHIFDRILPNESAESYRRTHVHRTYGSGAVKRFSLVHPIGFTAAGRIDNPRRPHRKLSIRQVVVVHARSSRNQSRQGQDGPHQGRWWVFSRISWLGGRIGALEDANQSYIAVVLDSRNK